MRPFSSRRLLLALLLAVLPLGPGACAGAAQQLQQENKDEELVHSSATTYWDAVRWGDNETAASLIEDPDDRLLFKDWLNDESQVQRLVDVVIVQVDLGEEIKDSKDGHTRQATIHVRTEGYTIPAQVLKTETVFQDWYRTRTGWFLAWESSEE